MSDEEQIRRAALDYFEDGGRDDKTETPIDVTVVDIRREIASAVVRALS